MPPHAPFPLWPLCPTLELTQEYSGVIGHERPRLPIVFFLIMGWATAYISKLKNGETVQFRPRGGSMTGKIESGNLCTVEPVETEELEVGDTVLCKVGSSQYLHLIKAIQGQRFQIGNNRGGINGWIGANSIYGKCVRVER